jgi:hypothetical protein
VGYSAIALSAPQTLLPAPPSETFAPILLRGYGTLSGYAWKEPGGSVLEIDCQDADKAKLVQAKYLSDLQVLPGVKEKAGDQITTYEVDSQGSVVAYCDQTRVVILSAGSDQQLQNLIQQVKPTGITTAQVPVPMFLDRWDKFNFRHYYIPWETPKGTSISQYDFTGDFAYAQKEDQAGVLVSEGRMLTDTADEMLNTGWNDWEAHEAQIHNLPVDIHLSAGAGGDPSWLVNRYRDQLQQKMPGFTGNFHSLISPYLGGQGVVSWNSTTAQDDTLGLLQTAVRRFANEPNVTSYLEPHAETHHGPQDVMLEYGPVADAGYRQYLKEKYGDIEKLARRWDRPLSSWDDVRVPEIASFAGWGPQAIDVGQVWRLGYEQLAEPLKDAGEDGRYSPKSVPAPQSWFQPNFDDSSWPELPGGGNDKELFLPKRPAVLRRTFDVPASWRETHPHIWLYEWDMNLATKGEVRIVLNGKQINRTTIPYNTPHWSAIDVSDVLKAGSNTLAMRLPQGYVAYKVYLSPTEPKQYPDLSTGLNAQWVDFIDFTQWSRTEAIRRGMEMIRQAAPNQGITLMHPDEYSDGLKALAVAYGGEFHNTGYMGGFYADYNTTLMRGADLPYSIEPAAPAANFHEWKLQWGLYQTEGVQAVDYFIHMGSIIWNPQFKADYEAHREQIKLMGQSHMQKAQTAILFSDRVTSLTTFPWQPQPDTELGTGYWKWNAGSVLRGFVPYDGLSQSSFNNGEAAPYRVVIDSNTAIMDPSMVSDIEKWVRAGGTFVTLAQTGRHTPEQADAWPIDAITGYKVTHIDKIKPSGEPAETGKLQAAPGQDVYGSNWNGVVANGLHLQKKTDDVQDLLLWADGSVAAGVRPLGKGFVVDLGAKFTGEGIPDRVNPDQDAGTVSSRNFGDVLTDRVNPDKESAETVHLRDLLLTILSWRKIAPEPAHLSIYNPFVILRHNVTNNGLYDTWTLFNQSKDQPQTVSVVMTNKQTPAFCIDMLDETRIDTHGAALQDIALKPMETRVFLTPRADLPEAPQEWFTLQRNWWRGTTPPGDKHLPDPIPHLARDLSADWKFQTLDSNADAATLLAASVDDASWTSRELGIWDVKEEGGKGHGVFRKTFTVPAAWTDGLVSIWLTSWNQASFVGEGRVWLDGAEVKPMSANGYIAEDLASLKAGSTHSLAVEVKSDGVLAGLRGKCWISFEPTPPQKIDLAGEWAPSSDGLHYDAPIALPGKFNGRFFKRSIFIDEKYKDQTGVITVDGDRALICVLVNGKLVRRHHHMIGERGTLNITPFLRFGEKNEIELVRWDNPGKGDVRDVFLGFFNSNPF